MLDRRRIQRCATLAAVTLTVAPLAISATTRADDDASSRVVSIDPDSRAALEKSLDEAFAKSGLPGVTVGLWVPDKGSWVASRGFADLKTERPMQPKLQAPIGSITKSFTATIALELVGEDKLHLEDTIDRWYPQIAGASAITVKMLLNHSSGFADISQLQLDLHCKDPNLVISPDELITDGTALPRAFQPGEGFGYSSVNTIILGRVMEKTTSQTYDALLRERLLEPLELNRTKLDTDGRLYRPFSHGYTDFCPNLPRLTDTFDWPQISFSAGALASTLADLHAWGIALGEGFGLTPELQRARIDEGLGVFVRRDEASGRVISFGHAGSEPGFGADLDYYPCTGAVVALMVNGDGGTGEGVAAMLRALDSTIKPIVDGKCSA